MGRNALTAATAIVLMLGWIPAGGGSPPARAPRAEVAVSASRLKEMVRSALRPGDRIVYLTPYLAYDAILAGPPDDNVLLVHVAPVKERIGAAELENWKRSVPVPVEAAELGEGGIVARWGKARIEVAGLAQMPRSGARSVVVLHPDFFLPLYENEVRGGLVDLSMNLYRTLADRGAVGGPLIVLDPLSVPSFPLKWGYLDELWRDLWRNPEAFRSELPEKWRLRKESESMTGFGRFEEAADILEQARRHFPKDGSLDYQLSGLAFMDLDVTAGLRFLNRAYKVDPRFLRAYEESGAYLVARKKIADAEIVLRAGMSVAPEDPALNLALMKLLVDRADAVKADDPEGATRSLEEALTLRVPEERKKAIRERIGSPGSIPPK